MADIFFIVYLIFMFFVILTCIHPKGIALQQEYMAWRVTKDFMLSQGIRWP